MGEAWFQRGARTRVLSSHSTSALSLRRGDSLLLQALPAVVWARVSLPSYYTQLEAAR